MLKTLLPFTLGFRCQIFIWQRAIPCRSFRFAVRYHGRFVHPTDCDAAGLQQAAAVRSDTNASRRMLAIAPAVEERSSRRAAKARIIVPGSVVSAALQW